jgi:hypothetical protein
MSQPAFSDFQKWVACHCGVQIMIFNNIGLANVVAIILELYMYWMLAVIKEV